MSVVKDVEFGVICDSISRIVQTLAGGPALTGQTMDISNGERRVTPEQSCPTITELYWLRYHFMCVHANEATFVPLTVAQSEMKMQQL